MLKKILGVLLLLLAVVLIIGFTTGDTLSSVGDSTPEKIGAVIGAMLPLSLYILGGFFLIAFDNVRKLNFIDGFKARKRQCGCIIALVAVCFLLLFITGFTIGASGRDWLVVDLIIASLPYFIPLIIFALMLDFYVMPYYASRKQFRLDDMMLYNYLSLNETFYSYSEDDSVLASGKVIFFPKSFCVVPISCVASVKLKNLVVERIVELKLTNGKKISMIAGNKTYMGVMAALSAYGRPVA